MSAIDKAMTPMQERMIQERLGALSDILKDIGCKFDLTWADSEGNIWNFNIMTEAEKPDTICISRQELEKQFNNTEQTLEVWAYGKEYHAAISSNNGDDVYEKTVIGESFQDCIDKLLER